MDLAVAGVRAFGGVFIGEIAALTAACLWAAATLMFGRLGQQLAPVVLNLVKGGFAIAFILLTLLLRAQVEDVSSSLTVSDTCYLLLSGGVGIGLGDTAYFAAINALGARQALLLETLAPPMAAVLAWIFLGETLSAMALVGIACTLLGIFWVISDRTDGPRHARKQTVAGLGVALLAVFCQASGAVLSRGVLAGTSIDPLFSALLRLVAGVGCIGVLVAIQPWRLGHYKTPHHKTRHREERCEEERCEEERHEEAQYTKEAQYTEEALYIKEQYKTAQRAPSALNATSTFDTTQWQGRWHNSLMALRRPSLLFAIAIAALLGTYLGIWLQQISLKYTATGIAQALLATSPLFVLPMAALLGDRISYRAVVGALIALSGVWILLAN